jgi:hypothetical protein
MKMTDWTTLKHAYGSAADVAALLDQLSPDPEASVWEELWSRLCHQGTVYSASFAALPVLGDVADQWKPKDRSQLLALAGSILASSDVHGASRDDMLRPIQGVVRRFQRLCRECLAEAKLANHDFVYLLQAARSFEGDQFWGQELDHLVSGEFPGTCPHCGVDLYLVIGEYGFFTTAEEWVQRAGSKRGKIERRPRIHCNPIDSNDGELPEVGRWLFERAKAAKQDEVAEWIRRIFGSTICPLCSRKFDIQEAIATD